MSDTPYSEKFFESLAKKTLLLMRFRRAKMTVVFGDVIRRHSAHVNDQTYLRRMVGQVLANRTKSSIRKVSKPITR